MITVWNEYRHERRSAEVARIYPAGIHAALASALTAEGFAVRTATLDEPDCGLSEAVLADTRVLVWWGHAAHAEVPDAVVSRVVERVRDGMGFVCLHSGHHSRPFRALMGASCDLRWRESGERERVWVVAPQHPIAAGLPPSFDIPHVEMYGEPFDVPPPDEVVFISWYEGGEVFRSGCCFTRGRGRIFYFSPGHETFPIYHQVEVRRVIANAVRWAGG